MRAGLRASATHVAQGLVRQAATRQWSRQLLNAWYARLDAPAAARTRSLFYALSAKVFRERDARIEQGVWTVEFAGKRLLLPLTPARTPLDWDTAVSAVGHEVHVKELYRRLLTSGAVDLFIDVGANYGTHSLLFHTHGVPTVTFEPNRACHDYFREACTMNRFTPRLEAVALGDSEGEVRFSYPVTETWNGSADPDVAATFRGAVVVEVVPMRTLDSYVDVFSAAPGRAVVKIDAEGYEMQILKGADAVLREHRPVVVFESWTDVEKRGGTFQVLERAGYRVSAITDDGCDGPPLSRQAFLESKRLDFIATAHLA